MDKESKERWKKLKEELCFEQKLVWDRLSVAEKEEAMKFSEDYKTFLNNAKTERESIREIVRMAEEQGFVSLDEIAARGKKVRPGNKVYTVSKEKNVVLAVIGKEPLWHGFNLVGSHVDAPRLDLKPLPLYEDQGIGMLKTHYYGGIKKYQWLSQPLSLHGVVIKQNGEKVNIRLGDDEKDPKFVITDLLPHLSKDQMQKKIIDAVS